MKDNIKKVGIIGSNNLTGTPLHSVSPTAIPFRVHAIEDLKQAILADEILATKAHLAGKKLSMRALRRAEARKLKPKYR